MGGILNLLKACVLVRQEKLQEPGFSLNHVMKSHLHFPPTVCLTLKLMNRRAVSL